MRSSLAFALALALALGGCATAPTTTLPPTNATTSTNPTANMTAGTGTGGPLPAIGERGPTFTEHFRLTADHTIAFVADPTKTDAQAKVPEAATGRSFLTGDPPLKPWSGPPSQRDFEAMQDIDLTLAFTSDQPAVTSTKAFSFPAVGGYFGTPERMEIAFSATDAPDSLDTGKVYVSHIRIKMPPGGLFLHKGESLAITPYLAYEGPGSMSWIVGGAMPAGFALPHIHFNVTAPNATIILDKSGSLIPNPNPTSDANAQPQDFGFTVPGDAVYIRCEVIGTPTASGTRTDVDLHIRDGSGKDVRSGTGPTAHEVVEIGPTALTASGRVLVAHVVGSGAGSTFKLLVTAYGP